MYYAVTFGRGSAVRRTYGATNFNASNNDWFMVPSSRPVIEPPKPKTTVINIPGSNNRIDLSEVLSGDITYENRTGSIEFIVLNEKPVTWYETYNDIMDFLHGRRITITLEEEPTWYYEGRAEVNVWKSDPDYSRVTIDYDLDPFKYSATANTDSFRVSGTVTKTYTNTRMPVMPKFTADASGMKVSYNGNQYDLPQTQTGALIAGIIFPGNSSNQLIFTGTGNVTVSYQEGKL